MAKHSFRREAGGVIDRDRPLQFHFDGKAYQGYAGDTLASALLANGVRLLGRSFKYHRPRGLFAIGPEEPNAMVTLREAARREPNIPATMIELFDGLVAESQNRWPSLRHDLMALNGLAAPLLPAGFYYKTFKWPDALWEPFYERLIRRAGGMGRATDRSDPDAYEKAHGFCDVLVVGGGPAGLAAARAAGAAGARVLLVEQMAWLGGDEAYAAEPTPVLAETVADLEAMDEVTVMTRTTAFGQYDGNVFGLLERVADHLPVPPEGAPRQRFWIVRAKQVVFATGAIEQPLVFPENDRPGVMLAGAVRGLVNRFGVVPGRRHVVFTNNESGYRTAIDLARAGGEVAAVVDPRAEVSGPGVDGVRDHGIEHHTGATVSAVGGRHLRMVDVTVDGETRRIACDVLAVSGGWQPVAHLQSHVGDKPVFSEDLAAFVPGAPRRGQWNAGSVRGLEATDDCSRDGAVAGAGAARALDFAVPDAGAPVDVPRGGHPGPAARIMPPRSGKRFLDLQHDVRVEDIELAHREGYVSVEHLKRYTMLGMATDQGKTSNVAGLARMAEARDLAVAEAGVTTFRPPYTPVAIGAVAGPEVGRHFAPERLSPMHDWHLRQGAVMVEAGLWLRPRYYPRDGEDIHAAYRREAGAVRRKVGMVDVTSLGKIDVQGPDAGEFLDRVYVNTFSTLPIGRARYGVMLRDDGFVFDDGTTSHVGETHYFMTTTTAEAGPVLAQMEFLLATAWTDLRVHLTSVSDQWAGIAVAGPDSRALLAGAIPDIDFSNEAFPFMGVREGVLDGAPVRVLRISFSGELAYEVYTPSDFGLAVWERLWTAGKALDCVAYGTEAMAALRIEKGHVAGPELDGRTTLADLGLARMASKKKSFVGQVLTTRPALVAEDRPRLVGLFPVDRSRNIRAGALLRRDPLLVPDGETLGHVTSVSHSPELGHYIGLALVTGGTDRIGETLYACYPLKDENLAVEVVSPHFVDPKGERLHA